MLIVNSLEAFNQRNQSNRQLVQAGLPKLAAGPAMMRLRHQNDVARRSERALRFLVSDHDPFFPLDSNP
jgi:hypothetical protein